MPIETICQTCNNRLRVADEHAGKLARCPKCQSVYTVPTPQAAGSAGAMSSSAVDQWRLKTADGMIYGPVPRADMDRWLTEGRVTPDSQLLQEGTDKWRWAKEVYPQLATAGFAAPAPTTTSSLSSAYAPTSASFSDQYGAKADRPSTGGNPFAASNPFSESTVQQNPYSAPTYGGSTFNVGRPYQPHRGVLILILGILGLTVCGLIGLPAAFMGLADLREINAGRMDPSGKGLTIAGMVMGWICVGLFALGILIVLLGVLAG
jgi:hypothetical protein